MRYLISILFLLLTSNNLLSQNTISLGIKSSYNSSNINFHNNFFPQNIKTSSINNINFTLVTEILNQKKTGIRIEISKLKKGWAFDEINNINKGMGCPDLDYEFHSSTCLIILPIHL